MDRNEVGTEINHKIKLVQHNIRLRMDEALRPVALTKSQYVALYKLAEFPGISNAELARKCFVTPQNMNVLIGGLKKLGLLTSANHETQGRIQKISLTGAGEALLETATKIVREVEDAMFEPFTLEDLKALLSLLGKFQKSENNPSDDKES